MNETQTSFQRNRYLIHLRKSFHEVLKRDSFEDTKNFVELTSIPIIIDDLWFLYRKTKNPDKILKAEYILGILLAKDYYFSYVPNNLVWTNPELAEILKVVLGNCVGNIPSYLLQVISDGKQSEENFS